MLDAVADIGNSRIKICRCDPSGLLLPIRGLDTNDRGQLVNLLNEWNLPPGRTWGLASTSPRSCESLVKWAEAHGDRVMPSIPGGHSARSSRRRPVGSVSIDY